MSSFKINGNIYKKEDGSYYVVSANKASSVTGRLQEHNLLNVFFYRYLVNDLHLAQLSVLLNTRWRTMNLEFYLHG